MKIGYARGSTIEQYFDLLMQVRTMDSLAAACARGRFEVRKPVILDSDMIIAHPNLADKTIPVYEVVKRLKVGRTKLYKYFLV